MQWFKHDSNSTMDYKIKKLIIRYGAVGYAIYFHCLELIAAGINDSNITFQLEHDSEIIADDLRIQGNQDKSGKELVEEIMRFMIQLNLFEESNGHIFCFKMLKRLDSSMTSSSKLRDLINKAKLNHDGVMINHDGVMTESGFIMQDKIRQDKITQEEKRQDNTRQEKNFCSEPSSEPKAQVEALILNDSSEWIPSQKDYEEWVRLYPNVNIAEEFRKMRAWCFNNPVKRKTKNGIKRFVGAWLGKEQDKPSSSKQTGSYQQKVFDKSNLENKDFWGE